MDRLLTFGLKYPDHFQHTHLSSPHGQHGKAHSDGKLRAAASAVLDSGNVGNVKEVIATEELAYDVAIVGGGAAGLSAALVLGRAWRRVAMIDAGSFRNAPAARTQGASIVNKLRTRMPGLGAADRLAQATGESPVALAS
jgi:threonine dehydrogenase-like Zn-dependent dehydrogenase